MALVGLHLQRVKQAYQRGHVANWWMLEPKRSIVTTVIAETLLIPCYSHNALTSDFPRDLACFVY